MCVSIHVSSVRYPPAVGDHSAGLAACVAGEGRVPGQEHRAAAEALHQILAGPERETRKLSTAQTTHYVVHRHTHTVRSGLLLHISKETTTDACMQTYVHIYILCTYHIITATALTLDRLTADERAGGCTASRQSEWAYHGGRLSGNGWLRVASFFPFNSYRRMRERHK